MLQFVLPGQFPLVTVTLSMAMSLVNDHPLIPSKVNWENKLTLLIDIDVMTLRYECSHSTTGKMT